MTTNLRSIISKQVITVGLKAPLKKIIEVMEDNNINHLPVIGDENMIVGIISKHDIYRNLLRLTINTTGKTYSEKSMATILAEEIMTMDVVELSPDDDISKATEILMLGEFHACPIVENYKVIGIVTAKDIMGYLTKNAIPLAK